VSTTACPRQSRPHLFTIVLTAFVRLRVCSFETRNIACTDCTATMANGAKPVNPTGRAGVHPVARGPLSGIYHPKTSEETVSFSFPPAAGARFLCVLLPYARITYTWFYDVTRHRTRLLIVDCGRVPDDVLNASAGVG